MFVPFVCFGTQKNVPLNSYEIEYVGYNDLQQHKSLYYVKLYIQL